jgi:hypothetical protein
MVDNAALGEHLALDMVDWSASMRPLTGALDLVVLEMRDCV